SSPQQRPQQRQQLTIGRPDRQLCLSDAKPGAVHRASAVVERGPTTLPGSPPDSRPAVPWGYGDTGGPSTSLPFIPATPQPLLTSTGLEVHGVVEKQRRHRPPFPASPRPLGCAASPCHCDGEGGSTLTPLSAAAGRVGGGASCLVVRPGSGSG